MVSNEELLEKLTAVADKALTLLEERTGLSLKGLPGAEVKRRVKAWERAQKAQKP